jgi:acyl-CoA thioesterase I
MSVMNNKLLLFSLKLLRPEYWLFCIIFIACQAKQDSPSQVDANAGIPDKSAYPMDKDSKSADMKHILFFGNSLTAGYGLDESEAFPALIQNRLDSLGMDYMVINGGLSGETSSGGKNRIDWALRTRVDIFVLELGANDMLRGFDLAATEQNLKEILDKVRAANPDVRIIIAGMQAPPNMGREYTTKFAAIYPRLAKSYNAGLIPFFLENVAAVPELNLPDGKHPNAQGQKIVMENVWKVLKSYL